jgi:hypothetical protein
VAEPGAIAARTAPPRRGPNPWLMLLIGVVIGALVGGAAGYLIWHGTSGNPSAGPSPTPSPTPSTTPTATPTTATSTPVTSGQNIVPCPVTTPSGQHVLGNPAGPGQNQHTDPTLDFCGHGNATLPAGTARFMTGDNWGVGIADSCPSGSAGAGGMGTVLTLTEALPGGGQGPDTVMQQGDWTDDGGMNMTTGGNYQLHVVAVSDSCVWHIAIYPS